MVFCFLSLLYFFLETEPKINTSPISHISKTKLKAKVIALGLRKKKKNQEITKLNIMLRFLLNFFALITRIFCFWFCFLIRRKQRQKRINRIATRLYKLGILKFFTHLVSVLRVIRKFRERTIFRKIKEFPFLLYMINDQAHFQAFGQTKSYFSRGRLLPKFLKVQINNIKVKKFLRNFSKKISFYSCTKKLVNIFN